MHLERQGVTNGMNLVYGIDIDPTTDRYLEILRSRGVPRSNLITRDFLRTNPSQFGVQMDVILGNPPYVRHHLLRTETIEAGRQIAAALGVSLSRRADLWAYVLLQALRFLAPSGRIGMLLPSAILHADYARPILSLLEDRFAQLDVIHVRERLFSNSGERTVVLLGKGFDLGQSAARRFRVEHLDQLKELMTNMRDFPPGGDSTDLTLWRTQTVNAPVRSRRERIACEILERCINNHASSLGQLATIRIGTVTGANRFFIRSQAELQGAKASELSIPIVSRGSFLKTPVWTEEDQRGKDDLNVASRLLTLNRDANLSKIVLGWIEDAESLGIDRRHHCSLRSPWYVLSSVARPDAFLPYMGTSPPRMVVNLARSASTNSIHGVHWQDTALGKRAVLSSWTTLFGIGVELFGRVYGEGVLKIEPSGAQRLPIIRLTSSHGLSRVEHLARRSGIDAAIREADRIVLTGHLGLENSEVDRLREFQRSLQSFRIRRNIAK